MDQERAEKSIFVTQRLSQGTRRKAIKENWKRRCTATSDAATVLRVASRRKGSRRSWWLSFSHDGTLLKIVSTDEDVLWLRCWRESEMTYFDVDRQRLRLRSWLAEESRGRAFGLRNGKNRDPRRLRSDSPVGISSMAIALV